MCSITFRIRDRSIWRRFRIRWNDLLVSILSIISVRRQNSYSRNLIQRGNWTLRQLISRTGFRIYDSLLHRCKFIPSRLYRSFSLRIVFSLALGIRYLFLVKQRITSNGAFQMEVFEYSVLRVIDLLV